MNTRSFILIVIFVIAFNAAVGQPNDSEQKKAGVKTYWFLSGTVVDSEHNTPLEFASIGVLNRAQGTLTNTSGSFVLRLSSVSQSDTVLISMIGYTSVKLGISENVKDVVIKMTPHMVLLKEVEVTDKRVTIDDIFKQIKSRVKLNYPVEDYSMECFYREIKKSNGTYQSLLEAALVIRDKGYNNLRSVESGFIREVRGSSTFTNQFSSFWQENNLLKGTLGLNAVRHPSSTPNVFGEDVYQLSGISTLNDKQVYVLVSDIIKNDCWQRTLYVDVETYAIYRSEEVIKNFEVSWKVDGSDSIYLRLSKGTSVLEFKTFNDKLYLSHIRHDVENEYFNSLTNKVLERFTIINDLLVNDIYEDSEEQTDGLKAVENYALELQVTPYNDLFWHQYNSIKQTPLESEIMNDLLKKGTLNDQFKKSSQKTVTRKKGRDQ